MPPVSGWRVIQVTDASDGELVPRMYSYWPNASVTGQTALVFVGYADGQVRFFSVDLTTGHVTRLGPMVPFGGTGEGWAWNRGAVHLLSGSRMLRVDPFTGAQQVVFTIEGTHHGCDLWQAHSSDDGQVHSATVRQIVSDGAYPKIGTVVSVHGQQRFYPARGVLDESQVDRSGRWLVIKEDDDNRIIDLHGPDALEVLIPDAGGAMGHSDCGHGFIVGEDNYAGTITWINLANTAERRVLAQTWNQGHVSTRGGRCLWSSPTHMSLVPLDGSGPPVTLFAHGSEGTDYDALPKANLDESGRVACYMTRVGSRFDVHLLVFG